MGAKKNNGLSDNLPKRRPAISEHAREQQMCGYAIDLAEKQLREGTASSQVITHYLKLATSNASLERQKLEEEVKLLQAKTKAYESAEDIKLLYADALSAMKRYSGSGGDDYD